MTCGIYQIETRKGQLYIGSSRNVEARLSAHLFLLRKGKHTNPKLQNSFNKNGGIGLFLIVCRREEQYFYEQRCLDMLKPSLNINGRATGADYWLGKKRGELEPATYEAVRRASLGRVKTQEENAKRSTSLKATYKAKGGMPAEHRANISAAKKGKSNGLTGHAVFKDLKRNANISAGLKATIAEHGHWRTGSKQSEETKAKIGAANAIALRGKTQTPESNAKRRATLERRKELGLPVGRPKKRK